MRRQTNVSQQVHLGPACAARLQWKSEVNRVDLAFARAETQEGCSPITLATPGLVDQEDYEFWRLVRLSRNRIEILDRAGLEEIANSEKMAKKAPLCDWCHRRGSWPRSKIVRAGRHFIIEGIRRRVLARQVAT